MNNLLINLSIYEFHKIASIISSKFHKIASIISSKFHKIAMVLDSVFHKIARFRFKYRICG